PDEEGLVGAGGGTTTFAAGGAEPEPPGGELPAAWGGRVAVPESRSIAIAAPPSRNATAAAATTPDLVTAEKALPLRGSLADTGPPAPFPSSASEDGYKKPAPAATLTVRDCRKELPHFPYESCRGGELADGDPRIDTAPVAPEVRYSSSGDVS